MNYTEDLLATVEFLNIPCPSPSALLRSGSSPSKGTYLLSNDNEDDFGLTGTCANSMSKVEQVNYVHCRFINEEIKQQRASQRERQYLEKTESRETLREQKQDDPNTTI